MPQPWYGQHPPGPSAQTGGAMMNHHRYHTGGSGPGGGNATTTYAAHRGSPTLNRPPSSASTSSTGSYLMHPAPVALPQAQDTTPKLHTQGHSMNMGTVPNSAIGHHGNVHHAGIPHHAPAARYPMPPRNTSMYLPHSAPGAHLPMRSHHSTVPPPAHAQPLRQISSGNTAPTRDQHDGAASSTMPSQYGSTKSPQPGSMPRQGNIPVMHHPVPYSNHPGMRSIHAQPSHHYQHHQYHHQGYYQNTRRSSYPPTTSHHVMGAHEGNYPLYQRPIYESPETVVDYSALSRSPSPPPAPTFPRDGTCNAAGPLPSSGSTAGLTDRRVLGEATYFKTIGNTPQHPSSDAQSAQDSQRNDSPHSNAPSKATVNEDDDAASILLQLSGVPSQAASQDASKGNDEGRPLSTVHTNNQGSFVPHSTSNLLKPIEASSSLDDDATIATTEGVDFTPDLTSEPSADSIDQHESDFPAPIPENYPTRLALKYDERKLNSLHCFLRSELLEIFVVQKSSHKSPTHSPGSSVGRVGLRCVHCAMVQRNKENREEAPMAVFYPKSVSEIYRLVTSWQRCHLRKCRNLPPAVRAKWQSLRDNDKSRGKTHYWITSAKEIGLVDCQSRAGGIRFGPNTKSSEVKQIGAPPAEKEGAMESSNESKTETAPLSESTSKGLTVTDGGCTASA